MIRLIVLLCLFSLVTESKAVDFAHDVVPVLKKHCVKCHAGTEAKGGFSVNSRELVLDAEAAVPGNSASSVLMERIRTDDADLQMPPADEPRLSAKETQILAEWIDDGLAWEPGFTFGEQIYEPPLKPRRPELPPSVAGRDHPIDRIIDHYLTSRDLDRPAGVADEVFLRRAYLDVVGLLPTPQQSAAWSERGSSREQLIDRLLANDIAYTEHWLTFWNDLLRNDYAGTGFITKGRFQISKWLYSSLLENKPYDQFVRDLLTPADGAEGFISGIRWRGTVNASQRQEIQFAQNVGQAFLGINLKCASCHDSFIDNWTLEETYGLAQVYATEQLELHRCDKPTGQTAAARWIFPELGQIDPEAEQKERLAQLSQLMTNPQNGRFSRTIVNRIWHRLMGRGIVHPVDAMHTEPWSEDLLDYLAVRFVDDGYDLKKLIRLICTSQAYQSEAPVRTSLSKGKYVYTGPLPRRMTAEQFVDTVWQVTGSAPAKIDAPVTRVAPVKSAPSKSQKLPAPQAHWIWSQDGVPPGNELIVFRKSFDLSDVPQAAVGAVTCDNEYALYVNGSKVGADTDWYTVESFSLQKFLQVGTNEIVIEARNINDQPNPAALLFAAKLTYSDGSEGEIGTDTGWQWTKPDDDVSGQSASAAANWQPAVLSPNPEIWDGRIRPQLQQALSGQGTASSLMVRASLLKADELMRALGRPNRDQIVTMRPEQLTTLEAIQLANGQRLADAIAAGAERTQAQFASDPGKLIEWMFLFTLSRQPTADEYDQAIQLLGETPTPQAVEDLFWAVLMLPEFQLVR